MKHRKTRQVGGIQEGGKSRSAEAITKSPRFALCADRAFDDLDHKDSPGATSR
jgi:hypothetical protein